MQLRLMTPNTFSFVNLITSHSHHQSQIYFPKCLLQNSVIHDKIQKQRGSGQNFPQSESSVMRVRLEGCKKAITNMH